MKQFAVAVSVVAALALSQAALAGDTLAGKYTTIKSPSELKGAWVLNLAKGRTYTVVDTVAFAAGGVAGTYTTTIISPARLKGKWLLTFAKGGAYAVKLNGKALARGRYSATETSITLRENADSGCGGSGTYAWKKAGRTLSFIRRRESASCEQRAAVLAHRFTQVR
jgi:hypothetical protein